MRNLTCWTDTKTSCRSSGTRDGNTCNWVRKRRRLFPPSLHSCLSSFLSRFFSFVRCPFLAKIARNQRMRLINVCLWFAVLEVMQFARDAHMAEGWMIAQEPYLKNENLGVSDIFASSLLRQCQRKKRKLSGYFGPKRDKFNSEN